MSAADRAYTVCTYNNIILYRFQRTTHSEPTLHGLVCVSPSPRVDCDDDNNYNLHLIYDIRVRAVFVDCRLLLHLILGKN